MLAGGTSAEELIEGLSIGVGAAIKPGLGLIIALAILIDNVSEALGIGELVRSQPDDPKESKPRRILKWTGLIGLSLFSSAMIGWFFLRGLPRPILGALFAMGGGMLYLTVTSLLPEAEARHYQQSAALAIGAGFVTIMVIGHFA